MIKYIMSLIYILFSTCGIFLMKLGGNSLSVDLKNGINFKMGYITFLGFLSYIVSFLLWQRLLTAFDLSYIVPITTGICQIIILLLGIVFFKEQINNIGLIGVILIIIGVVLLAFGKK